MPKFKPVKNAEAEFLMELVCVFHEDAGVRVYVDPQRESIQMVCRECGGDVAHTHDDDPAAEPLAKSKSGKPQVH